MAAFGMSLVFGISYVSTFYGMSTDISWVAILCVIAFFITLCVNMSASVTSLINQEYEQGFTLIPVFLPIVVVVYFFRIGEWIADEVL